MSYYTKVSILTVLHLVNVKTEKKVDSLVTDNSKCVTW